MTNSFSQQSISIKNQYVLSINSLFQKYDSLMRYQIIHHTQERLKEIQQLLRINEETFRLAFDEQLKFKMRTHLIFIKVLTHTIDTILTEEAIHEHTEHLKQTEAILKFQELDKTEDEHRRSAFEHVRQMMDQEREFALYAMLTMSSDIAIITIDNLRTTKSDFHDKLIKAENHFYSALSKKLAESDLFKDLTEEELQHLNMKLKKICDKVDARFAYPLAGNQLIKGSQQRQMLSFGVQPVHASDQEIAKALKKNKKVLKFLKKHHEKKLGLEKSSTSLTNLPRLEKLAKEAIKMHEEYTDKKREIDEQIKAIDTKIEREEYKKQQCLAQLEQIIEPRKRDRFKKTIERTYGKIEMKYLKEKERLKMKKEEKEICDTAVVSMHPEVLNAPTNSSSAKRSEPNLTSAVTKKLKLAKGILPGQQKWKSDQLSHQGGNSKAEDTNMLKGKPKGKEK